MNIDKNMNEYKQIIFDRARELSIDEYEIYYMKENSMQVETLKDDISSFASKSGGGISFRCKVDGKMGYASTELFEVEELRSIVDRAADNARSIENDDKCFIFAGSEKYESTNAPEYVAPAADVIKENALALQRETYAASDMVTDGTQSMVLSFSDETYLANSYGLELYNRVGLTGAMVAAVVNNGEEPADAYDFVSGDEMKDYEGLSAKVVEKAISKFGAGSVNTGTYNVVISGKQMKDILSAFSPIFSSKNAQLGLSLLAGKEGEKIASDCITITDDPMHEGFSVQTNFDGEGVATYKKNVVENGILTTLLYDLTSAEKAGKKSTGNGQRGSYAASVSIAPYCFSIEGGSLSDEELLAKAGEGILVTEIKGLHAGADAVTGDFSIESAGFMIENGKRGRAVKSFTISGNFFDLLKNISDIASEVKYGIPGGFTVFGSPDVLVPGLSVAGK